MFNHALIDRYKCPDDVAAFSLAAGLSKEAGFFRFGQEAICYGQSVSGFRSIHPAGSLYDVAQDVEVDGLTIRLPFDPTMVIDNLRLERYVVVSNRGGIRQLGKQAVRSVYYTIRPLLPVSLRRHLQKVYLRGWDKTPFPRWPVDFSVEDILERLLLISMKAQGLKKIPFIWFWPEGAPGCAIMTHDVEQRAGRDFCSELMDLDDAAGIKAAFQVVPEVRYGVDKDFLEMFRRRGFEVNVHDLNHDGSLFEDKVEFLRYAKRINQYAKEFGTRGFRAGSMYRNQEWHGALDISYDMSVPNVAHLEPQSGGCCTVMPYFIGNVLELPLTATQDYSLFHIIGDYSINLWKQQIELVLQRNGLISFIVHPDYVIEKRARAVYVGLLAHLARVREERKLWIALPSEVDRWWRNRRDMQLVKDGDAWRIEGPDKERARIAYAVLEGDHISYQL
jgi:hypothetical protein